MAIRRFLPLIAAFVVGLSPAASQAAITIDIRTSEGALDFDPTDFFTNNPGAMTALNAAADFFESIFLDDLEAITPQFSDDPGDFTFNQETMMFEPENPPGNIWAAIVNDPGTGAMTRIPGLNVAADTLIVYAGARNLSGNKLGVGGPGGAAAIGSGAFLDNVFTRGEVGADGDPATDFGPWGGNISFDTMDGASARDWHFDHTTDPSGGEADFFSVALHELAHLLGFGTSDSWTDMVIGVEADNPGDEFFTGAKTTALAGGNVLLEPGTLQEDDFPAHFAEDTDDSNVFFNGDAQEAAMDPNIQVGTRKLLTDLDVAALDDIGWEIAAQNGGGEVIPEPTTIALLGAAGLMGIVRRRRKN